MIEKVDGNQIQNLLAKSLLNQPDSAKNLTNSDTDVSLQLDNASLIEKAIQLSLTDEKAVEQAEKLLSSGRLDSPQNIRQAAENIINFGI